MRKMKPYLAYLFLFVLITSCSSKFLAEGKYRSKNSPHGFDIKKDSTFKYIFYQFHSYEFSTGIWHNAGKNKIVLNSFYKSLKIPLTAIESGSNKDSINSISFQINGIEIDEKDCECALFINDTLKEIKRCDSMKSYSTKEAIRKIYIEIRKQPLLLNSLRFSLEPLVTDAYSTSNEYGNVTKLSIMINGAFFSYKIFNNTIIKIKEKGIYFYDVKGNKKQWIPKLDEVLAH
jgi:hypothetical protein